MMTFQETKNANTTERSADPSTGVGALLYASRERLGEDLREIAGTLHIRFIYLQAIEESRFDDLPGAAYVIGFIRSYADYLGLDSAEVVRRYKEEAEAASDETELIFPVPIPESSIPGGAIILVGFMVAAVAYGLWYTGTAKDGFFAQMVAPVPERLADKAPQPEPEVKPSEPAVTKTEPVEPETKPVEPNEHAASDAPAVIPDVAEQGPMTEKIPTEASPVETGEATTEIEKSPEPAEQSSGVEQGDEQSDGDQVASTSDGNVYGTENQSFRILVKARQNSWIQVRDEISRQLVVTRVLRAGDSYRVPDQPGLKLLTGNAGALDIFVDGKAVPAIGESGTIRRSVALDPDRLVQGEAVD